MSAGVECCHTNAESCFLLSASQQNKPRDCGDLPHEVGELFLIYFCFSVDFYSKKGCRGGLKSYISLPGCPYSCQHVQWTQIPAALSPKAMLPIKHSTAAPPAKSPNSPPFARQASISSTDLTKQPGKSLFLKSHLSVHYFARVEIPVQEKSLS